MKKIIIILLVINAQAYAYNDLYSNQGDLYSCVCNDGYQHTERPYSASLSKRDNTLINYCTNPICAGHGGLKAAFVQGPSFTNDAEQDIDCMNGERYVVPAIPTRIFTYRPEVKLFECSEDFSGVSGVNVYVSDWKECYLHKAKIDELAGKLAPCPQPKPQNDDAGGSDDFDFS